MMHLLGIAAAVALFAWLAVGIIKHMNGMFLVSLAAIIVIIVANLT